MGLRKQMDIKIYLLIFNLFFIVDSLFGDLLKDEYFNLINKEGKIVSTRIITPKTYTRIEVNNGSFEEYLRHLPLKPYGSLCKFYNGEYKPSEGIYVSVVDQEIGQKNLHQCADAVIRLRAEYLWNSKQYDKIHFNFTNGFNVDYKKWMAGNRISVKGNKVNWISKTTFSNSYETFWKYLETVFTYAGTLSLEQEMKSVSIKDMKIGDVFIQGGSPGHAVIVVDIAKNIKTDEVIFLLAQSYMPAQETQVLINPNNKEISPWYSTKFVEKLITPEWTFTTKDLHRFID